MAGSEACKELIWIRSVFRGLGLLDDTTPPTILRGDNTGAIALAKNPEFHQRTKHIELWERFITFLVDKSIVKVIHIPTTEMLADGLTKPLSKERHHHHAERMGLDLNLLYTCGTCKSVFHSKNDFDTHIAAKGHDDEFTIGGKGKRALQESLSV